MGEWKVLVEQGYRFGADELEIFLAHKYDDTLYPATLKVECSTEPLPATERTQPAVIERQLGESLYNALGRTLTGITDPYNEIARLKRELAAERLRLDKLIDGIGRLGGHG